jgi:signal transduction histidine kinase
LHSGFGVPILHAGDVSGVIEFLDVRPRVPDPALVVLMATIGAQIGLFVGRRRAEDQVAALLERERGARADADAAVKIRDEFLASASHDLRAPLTAIRGYAALARRRLTAVENATVVNALGQIEAAVNRATAALDELLDLAQLQAGRRLALHRVRVDLVQLVRRMASDHEVAAQQCSIQVVSQLPELLGSWDAARLERALGNIVGNAVKFSPPGEEVVITIAQQLDRLGIWATVEVRDRGIGIPPGELPHIFERFYRAPNTSGRVPGTGLGLAGARDIVEQHGGGIYVESVEGQGSTFTIRLPVHVVDEPTVPVAEPSVPLGSQS